MADVKTKRPENVPGKFFVDDQCISCGACWAQAPAHFKSHDVHTYAFVQLQPRSEEESRACHEVKEICPVEAIGYDVP